MRSPSPSHPARLAGSEEQRNPRDIVRPAKPPRGSVKPSAFADSALRPALAKPSVSVMPGAIALTRPPLSADPMASSHETQPFASRTVAALESRLGIKLITTTTRQTPNRRTQTRSTPSAPRAARSTRRLSRIELFDLLSETGFDVEALVLQGRRHERRFDRPGFGRPRNCAGRGVSGKGLHRLADPLKQEVGLRLPHARFGVVGERSFLARPDLRVERGSALCPSAD